MDEALKIDTTLITKLRQDLEAAAWSVDTLTEQLSDVARLALDREQCAPGCQELQKSGGPAAIFTRLFVLGDEVDAMDALGAFSTLTLPGAIEMGLVEVVGTRVKARVDLRPHASDVGQWWVASDLSEAQTGKPLRPDHVLGIGQATLSLLRMTVRQPVERALDLGTGCGIQALYLATHAKRVIATDISKRACNYARFNVALNEVENIEVREGSLFEPVEGELFDQITSNPPFVITPDSVRTKGIMEYRDGGMSRDNLIATVLLNAPNFLAPGGLLQMLANWEIRGEKWEARPLLWLKQVEAPTATWLVQREELDPAQYAEMWLRDSGGDLQDRKKWEADYLAWIGDFQNAGVLAIGMGFVALRRLADGAKSIVVAEQLEDGVIPDGETVATSLLHLVLDIDWEEQRLVRADDVREERHYVPGTTDPEVIRLTQGAGMGAPIRVSSQVAALVGASDGELTIAQIIQALAVLTDSDLESVREQIANEPDLDRLRVFGGFGFLFVLVEVGLGLV